MSKKSVKQTVRVEHGQAVVVAAVEDLQHISNLYRSMAEYPGQVKADWYRVADLIDDWIDRSAIYITEEHSTND